MTAELCYTEHGGSGFSFTRADVFDMGIDEAEKLRDWLYDRRKKEAEAIRRASKKK